MASGLFGRLRALFGGSQRAAPAAPRTLYVEDDDWGDVEVLPAEVAYWCRAELGKIAVFANAHRAPNNTGWTDVYVRRPGPRSLADLRIPIAPVLETLTARLPAFDRVTSGSFSAPETVAGARAFGPSPQAAVIVIPDAEGTTVQSITLVSNDAGHETSAVIAVLRDLPSPEALIVVDWLGGELKEL